MSDTSSSFLVGVVAGVVIVLLYLFISNAPYGVSPAPISGRVIEKAEISTGYNRTLHALRLEVANDRYLWVATSAQLWHVTIAGVEYKFTEGDGDKYTGADEVTRE